MGGAIAAGRAHFGTLRGVEHGASGGRCAGSHGAGGGKPALSWRCLAERPKEQMDTVQMEENDGQELDR